MCVISLAKLRMEPPEKMTALVDQLKKSKMQKELSVDILDYMCDAANSLELNTVQTAFGVRDIQQVAQDFSGVSLDSLNWILFRDGGLFFCVLCSAGLPYRNLPKEGVSSNICSGLFKTQCFLVAGKQPDNKFAVFGQCLFIIRGGNKGDGIYQDECIVELKGTRIFNLVRGQVYGDILTLFFRECDG